MFHVLTQLLFIAPLAVLNVKTRLILTCTLWFWAMMLPWFSGRFERTVVIFMAWAWFAYKITKSMSFVSIRCCCSNICRNIKPSFFTALRSCCIHCLKAVCLNLYALNSWKYFLLQSVFYSKQNCWFRFRNSKQTLSCENVALALWIEYQTLLRAIYLFPGHSKASFGSYEVLSFSRNISEAIPLRYSWF